MHAVLARALALLALAAGAHGAAHVQCQDATKVNKPTVGKRERRRACMLVRALGRIPARSCSSVARGRARRACGACAGAGLQCRAVISGLAGHARRCLTVLTMAGKCAAMASGDWTPSYCKATVGSGNTTTAGADAVWTGQFDGVKAIFNDVPAAYATDAFCGKDKVKAGAGEDWLCAYAKFTLTVSNQCGKDTDCSKGGIKPACESYTAMHAGVSTAAP